MSIHPHWAEGRKPDRGTVWGWERRGPGLGRRRENNRRADSGGRETIRDIRQGRGVFWDSTLACTL